MKKLLLLLSAAAVLLSSCGGDDEEPIQPKQYEVKICNRIDASKTSAKICDGNLYDVNIVSAMGGQIFHVGDIANQKDATYKLPVGYDKDKAMFVIIKIGKNASAASANDYWTPEQSLGKLIALKVYDDRETVLYFTENTTYSSFPANNILDFKNIVQSIMAQFDL